MKWYWVSGATSSLCLPINAFELMEAQVIPTIVRMHALLVPSPTDTAMGPFAIGNADMQQHCARMMIPGALVFSHLSSLLRLLLPVYVHIILTEKNESSLKGITGNTMTRISLLWIPCKACQWSCQMELLLNEKMKQQSNLLGVNNRVSGHPNWLFGMFCRGNRA